MLGRNGFLNGSGLQFVYVYFPEWWWLVTSICLTENPISEYSFC